MGSTKASVQYINGVWQTTAVGGTRCKIIDSRWYKHVSQLPNSFYCTTQRRKICQVIFDATLLAHNGSRYNRHKKYNAATRAYDVAVVRIECPSQCNYTTNNITLPEYNSNQSHT
jgi:hypothetical protein